MKHKSAADDTLNTGQQESKTFIVDPADPRDTKVFSRWSESEEKILSKLGRLREFIEYEGLSSVHACDDKKDSRTTHFIVDGAPDKIYSDKTNLSAAEIENIIRSISETTEPEHDFSMSALEAELPGGQIFIGTLPPLSSHARIDIYSREERIIADAFCGSDTRTEKDIKRELRKSSKKKRKCIRTIIYDIIYIFIFTIINAMVFPLCFGCYFIAYILYYLSAPLKIISDTLKIPLHVFDNMFDSQQAELDEEDINDKQQ